MVLRTSEPRLRPEEFELLRHFFNRRAGLSFTAQALPVFEQRLGPRLSALGIDSFRDYYRALSFGVQSEAETEEALSLLTTSETYFFRNADQLSALREKILPELERQYRDGRRLRIWSAGCSSGEEAYTLAILLQESALFSGWDVRVLGSDLCKSRIQAARRGRYPESSFRTTAPWRRERYFTRSGSEWEVAPSLRGMCEFLSANLCETAEASLVGRVHAVLCRNVLIYLDDGSREKVVANLFERLLPGGFLLLGHSESLSNSRSGFELISDTHDTAYKKPGTTRAREATR